MSTISTPKAAIKFFNTMKTEIEEGLYDAPVQLGQLVWLSDGHQYNIVAVEWPFRVNGVCPEGQTDWEYATVSTIGVPIG